MNKFIFFVFFLFCFSPLFAANTTKTDLKNQINIVYPAYQNSFSKKVNYLLTDMVDTSISDGYCSVLTYGADSTGVNDSTAAFNSAIANCIKVYVPTGVYKVLSPVYINRDGIEFYGDGKTSLIKQGVYNTGQVIGIKGTAPVSSTGEPVDYTENIIIRDIAIDGGDYANVNGIGIQFAKNIIIKNVFLSNIGRKAITPQYHVHNLFVRDIFVEDACQELGSTHAALSIEGQIDGVNYGGGVVSTDLEGTDMTDIVVDGIWLGDSNYNGITISNARGVKISNFYANVIGEADQKGSLIFMLRYLDDIKIDNAYVPILYRSLIRIQSVNELHNVSLSNISCDSIEDSTTGLNDNFGIYVDGNSATNQLKFNNIQIGKHNVDEADVVSLNDAPNVEFNDLRILDSSFSVSTFSGKCGIRAGSTSGGTKINNSYFNILNHRVVLFTGNKNIISNSYVNNNYSTLPCLQFQGSENMVLNSEITGNKVDRIRFNAATDYGIISNILLTGGSSANYHVTDAVNTKVTNVQIVP